MGLNVSTRVTPQVVVSDAVTASDTTPKISTMIECSGMEWLAVSMNEVAGADTTVWTGVTNITGKLYVSFDGVIVLENREVRATWTRDGFLEFSIRPATHVWYGVVVEAGSGTINRRVVIS